METNAEQFSRMSQETQRLKRKNTALTSALIFFIILFLLAAGYLLYSELNVPPFGQSRRLIDENNRLKEQLDAARNRFDSILHLNDVLMEISPDYNGVFFEVQIGAFENFDLSRYDEALQKMNIDKEGNLTKYVLGKFRDYKVALAFKKDVEKMGIKDAFIVAKIDGARVDVEEALKRSSRNKR